MKLKPILLIAFVFSALIPALIFAQDGDQPPVQPPAGGVLTNLDGTFDGFTLFAPLIGDTVYLIDMNGQVVWTWPLESMTSQEPYLMEDGRLLYQTGASSAMLPEFGQVGGVAGGIRQIGLDGEMLWSFDYAGDTFIQHHDIEPLPNGNILFIAWEALSNDEALAVGMNPDLLPEGGTIWPDKVVEVNPATNEVVWEWRVWDHLIQDYDPDLPNYGVISEHPQRININYVGPQQMLGDWQHMNSIAYNADLDQIILSSRNFSEIWIIDHSTTTEEAAGSSGGRSGMGGDLLYRWGNPAAYNAGHPQDQQLYYQHDAHWIQDGYPGAGNILIFNNGDSTNESRRYSTVVEIRPPLNEDGTYARDEHGYVPPEIVWEYTADPPDSLFAVYVSGAQRLPNGNTFIVDGTRGRFLEVTPAGELVWEYANPFLGNMPENPYFVPTAVFRARRYSADYPGLAWLMSMLQSESLDR